MLYIKTFVLVLLNYLIICFPAFVIVIHGESYLSQSGLVTFYVSGTKGDSSVVALRPRSETGDT